MIRLIIILFTTMIFIPNVQANSEYNEIKKIIYDFIKFKNEVILNGEAVIELSKDNIKCSERQFALVVNDALNKRDLNNYSSRILVRYSFKLHDFQISKGKDTLVVTFFEDYEEDYEWTNNYITTKEGSIEAVSPGREDSSAGANRENAVTLEKDKNNEWIIVDHTVYLMRIKKETKKVLKGLSPFILKSNKYNGLDVLYPDKNSIPKSRSIDGKYKIKEMKAEENNTSDLINYMYPLENNPQSTFWSWSGSAASTALTPDFRTTCLSGNCCPVFRFLGSHLATDS